VDSRNAEVFPGLSAAQIEGGNNLAPKLNTHGLIPLVATNPESSEARMMA